MMMGVVGAICIVVGCGGLWLLHLRQQHQKVETIAQFSGIMLEIRGEILSHQTPLPRIFLRLSHSAHGQVGDFFQELTLELQEGVALQTAWEDRVLAADFPNEVEGVLLQVGRSFSGDEEQICKVLSLANGCLERILKVYQEKLPDNRRSFGALCFSGGALLLILLL